MINQEIVRYIKQKINSGATKESIKNNLMEAGWKESDLQEAFNEVAKVAPPISSPSPSPSPPFTPPLQPEKITKIDQGTMTASRSHEFPVKMVALIVAVVFAIALIAGGTYLYLNKANLFGIAPYSEKNLLSGLLTSASKINSASYLVSASLVMNKRDADAKPFVSKLASADTAAKQYQNDYKRAQDAGNLLSQLTNRQVYPTSLDSLIIRNGSAIVDPATQQPYNYAVTENGNNFSLKMTFETYSAISQIRRSYKFSQTTTPINDKTVTFTKDSYPYLYISSEPPKPFLVSLAESIAYIPPETNVNFSASAQTDLTNENSAAWKFNADATGDFGDLTYKFDVDALRKDGIYYVRINNMPAFFFSYIGFEKGQWVKFDTSKMSSTGGNYSFLSDLPEVEKSYKENRQKFTDLLKKMVDIADQETLFTLKNAPRKETVSGRALYRYDLLVNKKAIVPFYQRLLKEFTTAGVADESLIDTGYLAYLQSPEFTEAFDYYQKNTSMTLWVDSQGFPAVVSYNMRVVPADSATQLKDKQANVVFKMELTDINKSVMINAPTDAKNFEDILPAGMKDSAIKADLSTVSVNSAAYYDTNGSYANFCTNTSYTKTAVSIMNDGGTPICRVNANQTAFCACSSLKSDATKAYCIDSTGMQQETTDTCVDACTTAGACK